MCACQDVKRSVNGVVALILRESGVGCGESALTLFPVALAERGAFIERSNGDRIGKRLGALQRLEAGSGAP